MNQMMERALMVKSMEMVVRHVSDENIFDYWLENGVADGDIDENTSLQEITELGYCDDETFQSLLHAFAVVMKAATKGNNVNGSFYCDGFIS